LTDTIKKDYLFPTFYGDVTCAMGIFLCSYQKAEKLIAEKLHPKIKPVRITKGRALIAFSCYEYKNVMNVPPYNEIAMAIPIMVNARFSPAVLPMITNFSHSGYYIAGMPVTSYENQLRGNKIWGLPKVTQDIDINREGADCVTIAYEDDKRPYFTLRVPTGGSPTVFDVSSFLYTRQGGEILRSETNFKARFNVTKHMGQLFSKGAMPDREYLALGDTPSARLLHELDIERHPFQFRYAEHMEACFDLPDPNPPSWLLEIN
jgi:hypothetical protein